MPWTVKYDPVQGPKDWAVVKVTTGEVIGRTTSNKKAYAMKKAIEINYKKEK